MKHYITIAILLLQVFLIKSYAQQDPDKIRVLDIREVISTSNKLPVGSLDIVDINSNLEVRIDSKNLVTKTANFANADPVLMRKAALLNRILKDQIEIQKLLNKDLSASPEAEKIAVLGKFSDYMSPFFDAVKEDPEIRSDVSRYIREYRTLTQTEKDSLGSQTAYIMYKLTQETVASIKLIEKDLDRKSVKIQMRAYLQTKAERDRKVHIENFDLYSTGEFFEIQRWATSFSQEDIDAFKRTENLALALNKAIDGNWEEVKQVLKVNIASVDCAGKLVESINAVYSDRKNLFKTEAEAAGLLEIKENITALYETIDGLKNINDQVKGTNILELFNNQTKELFLAVDKLNNSVVKLLDAFPQSVKDNDKVKAFNSDLNICKVAINNDKNKVNEIVTFAKDMLTPFKTTAKQATQTSDDILSFSIGKTPSIGYIDLKNTGVRENGDKLEIKLFVITLEDSAAGRPGQIIEQYKLNLLRVKVYSISNISMILAHPYGPTENFSLDNYFQFAPAGNLLLKKGSREHKAWNLIEPGLGFTISTPDFDLDGSPEVGIGTVATLFHDVLSFGWAYNTKTDSPYWFFGLSLPFSTLGIPINTIKTESK